MADGDKRFVDLGQGWDINSVDVDAVPTNAMEYLKQVIVGRRRAPAVVAVKLEPSEIRPPTKVITEQEPCVFNCEFLPSKGWRNSRLEMFKKYHKQVENLKEKSAEAPTSFDWPVMGKSEAWKEILFSKPTAGVVVREDGEAKYPSHKGTPPLVSILRQMHVGQVNYLIEVLEECYLKDGYSRALFEWLFAALLFSSKPLHGETCNSLRQIAKQIRVVRSTLGESDKGMIHELTYMLVIIAEYFNQKDLMDR
ncbi:hypothetical protein L596_019030 [Steinernema carpocapsae]|uniref:Gem-associated protein 2 n=1 Tax=Steinernema carpocapsae TaxID=34508 RepID=A0A4U5N6L8_STECR|nr:hypothetical protein L596_019030 [Steinernema carpocapsae]